MNINEQIKYIKQKYNIDKNKPLSKLEYLNKLIKVEKVQYDSFIICGENYEPESIDIDIKNDIQVFSEDKCNNSQFFSKMQNRLPYICYKNNICLCEIKMIDNNNIKILFHYKSNNEKPNFNLAVTYYKQVNDELINIQKSINEKLYDIEGFPYYLLYNKNISIHNIYNHTLDKLLTKFDQYFTVNITINIIKKIINTLINLKNINNYTILDIKKNSIANINCSENIVLTNIDSLNQFDENTNKTYDYILPSIHFENKLTEFYTIKESDCCWKIMILFLELNNLDMGLFKISELNNYENLNIFQSNLFEFINKNINFNFTNINNNNIIEMIKQIDNFTLNDINNFFSEI